MKLRIFKQSETVCYAAEELIKYVGTMTHGELVPAVELIEDPASFLREDAIVLGLLEELGRDASDLEDPFLDDIIDIDIQMTS